MIHVAGLDAPGIGRCLSELIDDGCWLQIRIEVLAGRRKRCYWSHAGTRCAINPRVEWCHFGYLIDFIGAPDWTRTSDPRLRRPVLYPAELRAQFRETPECGASERVYSEPAWIY
jgi:hypothetical protein